MIKCTYQELSTFNRECYREIPAITKNNIFFNYTLGVKV